MNVTRYLLAIACFAAWSPICFAQTFTWNLPGDGFWSDNASWTPSSGFPSGSSAEAVFGDSITSTAAVTLSGATPVNRVTFDGITGTKAYTLGLSTITLSGAGAQVETTSTVTSTSEQTFTGIVGGTGNVIVNGGRLLLSHDNSTFSGNVQVNTGRLQIQPSFQNDRPLGSAGNNVTVAPGGQLLNAAQGFNEMPYALTIAGNGVAGAPVGETGALRFTGASPSRWTGLITLSSDANIRFSGSADIRGGVNLGSNTLTFLGAVNEVGIVSTSAISGAGNVRYDANSTTVSVNSTYTGTTLLQSGSTFVSAPNALGASLGTVGNKATVNSGASLVLNGLALAVGNKLLTLNGGELFGNSFTKSWAGAIDLTAPSVIGAGGIDGNLTLTGGIANGGNLLTMQVNFSSSVLNVDGVGISGAGGMVVTSPTSPGVVRLNATSSYTGQTTVNSGILAVNAATGTGSGAVVVNGGTLAGVGSIDGATTIASGGLVSPGDPIQVNPRGGLTLDGGLTMSGGGTYGWKLGGALDNEPGHRF